MTPNTWLRRHTKLTSFCTLFLIFAGGMVTSTDSGLAVPDWPLSYGSLFPPMVGGVFYEHGHRMVASLVGLLTLILAIWLWIAEKRRWVKVLGVCALVTVIAQGILGGITVLFYLPTSVSVSHATLAQTFFLITLFISYTQSVERTKRVKKDYPTCSTVYNAVLILLGIIYIQLILGAIMRHTGSGLAVYDFPTIAGTWLPTEGELMTAVNSWRFDNNLNPVTFKNIVFHLMHRVGALCIVIGICFLNYTGLKYKYGNKPSILKIIFLLNFLVIVQILLGIASLYTLKDPVITSIHVLGGATILGLVFYLLLKTAPLSIKQYRLIG